MIALPDRLPLIQHGNLYVAPLQRAWVDNSLKSAATAAGYDQWWLIPHVSEGVSNFLGEYHNGSIITTKQVEETLRRILSGIGYDEVARQINMSPPPVEIPLPLLAEQAAGQVVELAFFKALDHEISQRLAQGAHNIRFTGLKYAIKKLLHASRWTTCCNALRQEILQFLDHRMRSAHSATHLAFTVN